MSKYSKLGWSLGISGTVIFSALIATSPHFHKCVDSVKQEQAKNAAIKDPSSVSNAVYGGCFADAIHESHGVITALATIVIGIFTFTLWMSGEKDLEYRRTYIDRAYLDAGPGGGDGPMPYKSRLIEDGKMRLRLQVTNHGRTPATLIRMCWHITALRELPTEPVYTNWQPANLKVSPETTFLTRYRRDYDMNMEPSVSYGCVEYLDVFGNRHHNSFLLRIVKNETGDDFHHPPYREAGFEKYWSES